MNKDKEEKENEKMEAEKREWIQLEYNNIKQEIFVLMQRCDNLIIAMYTVSITLIGLGYELKNKYFFMLTILFIIPVQGLINVRRYHMARCSTYIKMCIESQVSDLKWENSVGVIDGKFKETYLKDSFFRKIITYIAGVGTVIIAFMAWVSYANYCVDVIDGVLYASDRDAVGLVIATVLFCIICFLIKEYIDYKKICEKYEKIIAQKQENPPQ